MLKNLVLISFLLITFSSNTTIAKTQSISFTDPTGAVWDRWVETEKLKDGNLLLVVENPQAHLEDETVSQKTILKKYYTRTEFQEFKKDVEYYSNLKDLNLRSASYYENASLNIRASAEPLWTTVKSEWSAIDEANFAKWVSENISAKFAEGEGVKFDCADFAVFVRWIYAHDNRLPVANSLAGSGKLFGHWSGNVDWNHLPTHRDWRKDARFKEALKYLFKGIFTHTIKNDLYPVKLSASYITPGTVLLNLYSDYSGHTQVVSKIGNECNGRDCIKVLSGNEPAAEHAYEEMAWILNLKQGKGGFLRWKLPIKSWFSWKFKTAEEMPGYSLEQYSHQNLDNDAYIQLVFDKIGLKLSPLSRTMAALDAMESQLAQRIQITIAGHFLCHVQICDSNSTLYDNFSTPSRDLRFQEWQMTFQNYVSQVPAEDMHLIQKRLDNYMLFPVLGTPYTYKDYILNTDNIWNRMSADPTKPIYERWGAGHLSKFKKYYAVTLAWAYAMAGYRMDLVEEGFNACFPKNGASPKCTHSSVEHLKTTRIDQSLRMVKQYLRDELSSLTEAEQNSVLAMTQRFVLYMHSADSYLFGDNNWVENMSSNPWDVFDKRWGL